ncbi:MAG: roadblock/LC7 domain-containing protein [Gammaproteobacteria bacterium]|nr:roadblock/LC7 domain-containing protein [Xanthomonadales bacterium]MCB1728648.1 roadblock/LC7 domain-containing protein [Gammaproteobacteria bacterium]
MSNGFNLPASIAAVVGTSIRRLHQSVPAVAGCVVATVDGRLLDHVANGDVDPKRIAAMIGSMVALGKTLGSEVRIGDSSYVAVHASNGIMLMQQVPSRRQLLVVATLATASTNLGVVLHATRLAASEIGAALDDWLARGQAAA